MRQRAKGIRGAWFDWREAEYGRFNFQRDAWLDEMARLPVAPSAAASLPATWSASGG